MSRPTKRFHEKVGRHITIIRRGRRYYAEICVGGRQSRQSLGTTNLKAARGSALELDAELQRGHVPSKPERISLLQAVADYMSYIDGENRRPKTRAKYQSSLSCFLKFAYGQGITHLDQVSLLAVEKYRAFLRQAEYADTTLEHRTTIVKQLTRWALERDLLQRDPLVRLKNRKGKATEQPCFALEQVESILNAATGQLHLILEVLANAHP